MIGYKGIILQRGILRAEFNPYGTDGGDIFEIGVPKQVVDIDDRMAFTENGYSFCRTIEGVLNWMDYISETQYRRFNTDVRLFEIDTLDSDVIVKEDGHCKAKQIVVNREISPEEIIQYFKKYPERLSSEEERMKFDKYCEKCPQPYKVIKKIDDIEELMVKSCCRFGKNSVCVQNQEHVDIKRCKECIGSCFAGAVFDINNKRDYKYLIARSKLYAGSKLELIEEYDLLKNNLLERKNLELLAAWISNK